MSIHTSIYSSIHTSIGGYVLTANMRPTTAIHGAIGAIIIVRPCPNLSVLVGVHVHARINTGMSAYSTVACIRVDMHACAGVRACMSECVRATCAY